MRLTYSAGTPAMTGVLALAAALAAAPTAGAAVTAQVADHRIAYGERLLVRGSAPPKSTVVLHYRAVNAAGFVDVATATAGADGRYRLRVALSRSGTVRVTTRAPAPTGHAATFAAAPAAATSLRRVRVGARLRATSARLNVAAGRRARVSGSLRRPRSGRVVALQARTSGRWRTVDRDRTDARGRFRLSTVARGSADLRVRFRGDAMNTAASAKVGRMRAFRQSFASWYGPGFYGRRTACGQTFHAGVMGVAHKTLPCGTRLTFRRGDRIVRARVIDRGPFHPGREFDLSPAVKRALGFGSTGPVWVAR